MVIGIETVVAGAIAVLSGLFVWLFKRTAHRLDQFDERLRLAVTEPEVRLIIEDKVSPIREEIHRIDKKLDILIQLNVHRNNRPTSD